eukprot:14341705-Alexandrium_andersonii.AAC.1
MADPVAALDEFLAELETASNAAIGEALSLAAILAEEEAAAAALAPGAMEPAVPPVPAEEAVEPVEPPAPAPKRLLPRPKRDPAPAGGVGGWWVSPDGSAAPAQKLAVDDPRQQRRADGDPPLPLRGQ